MLIKPNDFPKDLIIGIHEHSPSCSKQCMPCKELMRLEFAGFHWYDDDKIIDAYEYKSGHECSAKNLYFEKDGAIVRSKIKI